MAEVILSGPLSSKASFSVAVVGPWGSRELSHIIAVLTLQHDWLAADEAAELLPEAEDLQKEG